MSAPITTSGYDCPGDSGSSTTTSGYECLGITIRFAKLLAVIAEVAGPCANVVERDTFKATIVEVGNFCATIEEC